MRKYDYLICYDIADPRRLVKIAKYLEKRAFRIQYSIFLLKNATKVQIYQMAQDLNELINPKEDDIRIYTIEEKGVSIGIAYDLDEIFIIR